MPNRTVTVRLGVDASGAVSGLRKVVAEARGAAAGIKTQLGSTTGTIDKVGASSGRLGGGFRRIGLAGAAGFAAVGAGAIGLGVGLGRAVSKAATFESSMRQVGKQAGLSGDALKGMTDLALEMGEKTSFSAQGASDAMLELAKGGLTAAEIRAGALEQTLTLASAGGLELGEAAGYMTQGLNTFNLSAKDSGRVASALAGGANASTASVQELGTALSQVGPGAALLGLSIEDTTAALAAFTNNGMKGSDAGTSLKTMLNSLQPSTDAASTALRRMGIVTEDGTNKFFNAQGEIRSMSEVAGLLEKGLKGQTAAQKAATLETIFGSDAYRAAAILAKEGADGVAEYVKATSDVGAAQDLAKSATEGFSGAMERFQGSLETAQIQLGTKFLPILTRALDYLSGPGMDTFSAIAGILRDTFAPQIDKATGGIERFFDYLSTHQADVIRTFQGWGNGVFDFGVAVAKMAAGGLRSIGRFTVAGTDAVLDMVEFIIKAFDDIPFVDMSDSIDNFKKTRTEAEDMATRVQRSLNGVAGTIEDDVIPSVEGMRDRFNKSANTQIIKAEQRDQVARIDKAIRDLSKSVEGNSRTTKDNSATLDRHTERGRINRAAILRAKDAMDDKARADFLANVETKGLTRATDIASSALSKNEKRLEEAALAAGFSKREVRKMIDQYKLTPDELKTTVSTPGMSKAREQTQALDRDINNLNSKSVNLRVGFTAGGTRVILKPGTRGGGLTVAGGPSHGSPLSASIGGHRNDGPEGPVSNKPLGGPHEKVNLNAVVGPRPNVRRITQNIMDTGLRRIAKVAPKHLDLPDDVVAGTPGGRVPTRNVGAGWGPVQNAMSKHGARSFTTYPGHHPSAAMARDVTPHNWAAANAARALSSVWYVIYRMRIASKNHGNVWRPYRPTNFRGDWQHVRHIHVARRYDQGGTLKPGLTLAYNGTRKPEQVVTNDRWQQLINTRSSPAKIDSADMARLVEALAHRPAPSLTINNPVREPASRSIATASNYASR